MPVVQPNQQAASVSVQVPVPTPVQGRTQSAQQSAPKPKSSTPSSQQVQGGMQPIPKLQPQLSAVIFPWAPINKKKKMSRSLPMRRIRFSRG